MPAGSLYVAFVAPGPAGPKHCLIAHSTNNGLVLRSLDGASIATFSLPFTTAQDCGETESALVLYFVLPFDDYLSTRSQNYVLVSYHLSSSFTVVVSKVSVSPCSEPNRTSPFYDTMTHACM